MAQMPLQDAAATALLRRFRPCIRFAFRTAGLPWRGWADAEQEVSIRVVLAYRRHPVEHGRTDLELRSWIINLSRNVAIDMMRAEKRQQVDAVPADAAVSHHAATDELVRQNDALERISRAIDKLACEKEQRVLRLTMAGHAPREVAYHMRMPAGTVRRLLHDARQGLRRLLVGSGLAIALAGSAQVPTDSLVAELVRLRQAVHAGAMVGVPDPATLDSLCNQVVHHAVDHLQHVHGTPHCSWLYTPWGRCVAGVRTRMVRDRSPPGCTGTPLLEQPCP